MLTTCKECELPVSDKALSCPHCGFPLNHQKVPKVSRTTKHKRLPNGFGQISEIKNMDLRNRYRAMVTVGKTETGRCIVKPLKPQSYFRTYNDAYEALAEYHKNPYDLDNVITVKDLYERWTTYYFATLKSVSSTRTITSSWAYCSEIYNLPVRELRARHIKGCVDHGLSNGKEPSANIKSRIKSMFNLMLDYALEYEIVDRNYARTFNISDEIIQEQAKTLRGHIAYTEEEMNLLWNNSGFSQVDSIIIQCYSGWRPQELVTLKTDNIDLEKNIMTGGMKTEAGMNRIVPIHPKIKPLIERYYHMAEDSGTNVLFRCEDDSPMTYDKYQKRFVKTRDALGLNKEHRPHDGRKQFVTIAKNSGMDEYAIKRIIGHKIEDLTERVYTERGVEWLQTEMQKIK